MKETFLISPASLRSQRRFFALAPLIALGCVAFTVDWSHEHLLKAVASVTIVVGIVIFITVRQYRSFSSYAQSHSLTLCDEFILFRDADIESRVPYSCIEKLTIGGTLKRATAMTMQCRGLPDNAKHVLYGYDQLPRIVDLVLQKVPHATVRTRGLFTYNKAFKGRRA